MVAILMIVIQKTSVMKHGTFINIGTSQSDFQKYFNPTYDFGQQRICLVDDIHGVLSNPSLKIIKGVVCHGLVLYLVLSLSLSLCLLAVSCTPVLHLSYFTVLLALSCLVFTCLRL